jgi:hypothetical protein
MLKLFHLAKKKIKPWGNIKIIFPDLKLETGFIRTLTIEPV